MTIRNDIEKLKIMFDALDIAQPALKKEKPQDDEVATEVGLDAVDFNKKPEPNHGLDTVKDKELEQLNDIVSPVALYVCNDCAKVAEGENLKCSQCDSLDIEVITEYEGEKGPLPKRTPEEILQDEEDEEINLRDDAKRDEYLARKDKKESVKEFDSDPKYKSVARGMDKEEAEKYAKQNGGQVTVDDSEENKDEFNPKFMVVKKENESVDEAKVYERLAAYRKARDEAKGKE